MEALDAARELRRDVARRAEAMRTRAEASWEGCLEEASARLDAWEEGPADRAGLRRVARALAGTALEARAKRLLER